MVWPQPGRVMARRKSCKCPGNHELSTSRLPRFTEEFSVQEMLVHNVRDHVKDNGMHYPTHNRFAMRVIRQCYDLTMICALTVCTAANRVSGHGASKLRTVSLHRLSKKFPMTWRSGYLAKPPLAISKQPNTAPKPNLEAEDIVGYLRNRPRCLGSQRHQSLLRCIDHPWRSTQHELRICSRRG
jgi:hypothetical protein